MNARTETLLIAGILIAGFVALAAAGPAHADIFGGDDIGGARKRRAVRRRVRLHKRVPHNVAAAVATVESQPGGSASSSPAEPQPEAPSDDDGGDE